MNFRSTSYCVLATLLVLAWSHPAFASPIAVAGTVDQSGAVTPGGTALTNPPGPDEVQGVFEVDLNALRALVPGSTLGSASLGLNGVRFDAAKTIEMRTYTGDLVLSGADFGAGNRQPVFSQFVSEPTGPAGLDFTVELGAADLQGDILGFNFRESESDGHALIGVEMTFIAVLLIAGLIGGLAAIEVPANPQFDPSGIPDGTFVFGPPELTFIEVPEPNSLVLLLLGTAIVLVCFYRRFTGSRRMTAR
ncbi:MAG: PEP-CTERM sorting domain-containing protein [Pirellulales bacterium]